MKGLPNLEYLNLSNLKLSENTFENLLCLERLSIVLSDFSNITNEAFQRLYNLEYLSIYEPENNSHITLSGMPRLKLLHLDSVASFQIDFSTNPSLVFLSFSYCTNPSDIFHLKHSNLRFLRLGNCKFLHFDANLLPEFTNLKNLTIERSEIRSITFSEHFSSLHTLVLKSSEIKRFDSSISLLKGLKSLDLSRNDLLESTPNMFMGLDNLEYLNLFACPGLREIPLDMFNGLYNLLQLEMHACKLTHIHPDAFSHVPKLTILRLEFNKLKLENAGVLRNLNQLKELHFCGNQIVFSNIDRSLFSNLASLEILDLREKGDDLINKLKSNKFENLKNLKKLYF